MRNFLFKKNLIVIISKVLREEFVSLQIKYDQMQTDYIKIQPNLLGLQQQLESEKRLTQQLEEKLLETKKLQLEMLDAEVRRYDP